MKPATRRLLRERTEARDEAQEAWQDAIIEAWNQGCSLREIGSEVGSTHVGISRLLERLGVRRRWLSMADANRELDRRDRLQRGE